MFMLPETRESLILRLPDAADAAAWDEFVELYGPLVYRMARRRGLQPADAEDLVQEVLAAVSRCVEQWLQEPQRGRFRAWLLCIARNTAINFLTRPKHQRLGTGGSNVANWLAEQEDKSHCDFDWEYRREIFRWAAEQVRGTVSESTWSAFWLTTVGGRTIAEAAGQLGMSIGAVYIARSRVMARLRFRAQRFEEQLS
jgi:RNA polymerase sigma-70 factor (ECF subfamily)